MDPKSRWQDLNAAWRDARWEACVEALRPLVDELPEVLSTRLLLAKFAARAGNAGLALLHYEKMLVLAVGQGELFHALAAERGLDALRHDDNAHRKRLQALQQWFKTMPPRARGRKSAARLQSWMVELPPAEFRRCAEAASLMVPVSGAQPLEEGAFAIVLHGAPRWNGTAANAGDAIAAEAAVTVEADEPGALLCFGGEVAALLRERLAAPGDAAATPAPQSAPTLATPSGPRPEPDPELEPLVSLRPFPARRREHELVVHFGGGTAELGMAGTRTGAIPGRLAELSPAGLTVSVPRATVRQSRGALEGAHVMTRVLLPGDDEPLQLAARVTEMTFEAASLTTSTSARLALEFVLLLAPDRARLQEALIAATRDGRWPWAQGETLSDSAAA